ncbi:3-oxoacyl-[acyl-carrier-protein] reductase [Streptomyces sp. NPDC050355]|uniref:3-oxoacyl-[acyl-carrier-protein] reductase n=1 Tax=Streptomyces sirii TaxID=3127701 RepID=A0ABZ2QV23_9ACTN
MPDNRRPVALVTGGTRGIGRAVARRLAADGYDIAYCGRGESAGRTAELLTEHGAAHFYQACDVADGDEVGRFVKRVARELGPIDVLVNSAGVVRDRNLVMMPFEDWTDVIDTNLTGTFHFCRAVGFQMVRRRTGAIVNMSSVSGVHGHAGQANYAASKGGVNALSRSLAKELARYGVRVNAVAPGFIESDMTDELTEQAKERALAGIPMARFGTTEEVADLTAFLVSDRAAYITGQVLQIDGGISL